MADFTKVSHVNTLDPAESCEVCSNKTTWRCVWKPLGLFEVRKPVCPGCMDDFMRTARLAGRVFSTLKTGTNKALGSEPPKKGADK